MKHQYFICDDCLNYNKVIPPDENFKNYHIEIGKCPVCSEKKCFCPLCNVTQEVSNNGNR